MPRSKPKPKLFESSSPAGKGALLFIPCAADLGRETTGSNSANAAAPEQPATEAVDPVAAGILAHTDTDSNALFADLFANAATDDSQQPVADLSINAPQATAAATEELPCGESVKAILETVAVAPPLTEEALADSYGFGDAAFGTTACQVAAAHLWAANVKSEAHTQIERVGRHDEDDDMELPSDVDDELDAARNIDTPTEVQVQLKRCTVCLQDLAWNKFPMKNGIIKGSQCSQDSAGIEAMQRLLRVAWQEEYKIRYSGFKENKAMFRRIAIGFGKNASNNTKRKIPVVAELLVQKKVKAHRTRTTKKTVADDLDKV